MRMIKKTVIVSLVALMILSTCRIALANVELNLPESPVTFRVIQYPGPESYFKSQLKNVSSGYDVENGNFTDWCGHVYNTIEVNKDYTNTFLYSIYNSSMPSYLWHSNWSKVNYILNHKIAGADWMQVQRAIWYLLDFGDGGLNADGWSMVNDSILYGDSYEPTYFDIIGIIVDPGPSIQRQILELRPVDPNGDADNDTVLNINEDVNSDGNPNNDDSDGDGISNYQDPDDDNDSILTIVEVSDGTVFGQDVDSDGTPNYLDTDSDGDTLLDAVEGTGDHDADGIPNYLDYDDIQEPSKVDNLIVLDAKDGKLNLSWDAATDNIGVDHYEIYRDGVLITNVTVTSYQDIGLTDNQTYTYTIVAVDAVGNQGEPSDPVSGTPTDGQAPSKVTGLTIIDAKDGKLDLTWDAATDNIGVDHYEIYRDGILLTNVTGTSYQDIGLTNDQTYTYTIVAVDAAGNQGEPSDPVSGASTKTVTHHYYNNDNFYPENKAPIADLSAGEPYVGIVNENIIFNASLSYDPDLDVISYYWDFGDGATSTEEIATHSYDAAGKYNVTLAVADSHGKKDIDATIASIVEAGKVPQPEITGPDNGFVNIEYNFSFILNDYDKDIKFIINWGDGSTNESEYLAAGVLFTQSHKWTGPGAYNITVTASDGQTDATTIKTMEIFTQNAPSEKIPESNNFLLILLALLALMFLILFLLLGKRRKDDEEDKK